MVVVLPNVSTAGQFANDGAPPRHACHADGERDGDRRRQAFGNRAHRQSDGRHEHLERLLSAVDADREGERCENQNDHQQDAAEAGDLARERGF
jgi:hypothetical protein